jgi:hypothetical protein
MSKIASLQPGTNNAHQRYHDRMAKVVEQIEALKADLNALVKEARDADLDGANLKKLVTWEVKEQIEAKNEALRRLRETALAVSQDLHDQLFLPLEAAKEDFAEVGEEDATQH